MLVAIIAPGSLFGREPERLRVAHRVHNREQRSCSLLQTFKQFVVTAFFDALKQGGGKVAFARIGQHDQDDCARAGTPGHLQRGCKRAA